MRGKSGKVHFPFHVQTCRESLHKFSFSTVGTTQLPSAMLAKQTGCLYK